mmetsp:Transcript_7433/g.17961  ORF Transcript_7433/g.17961 Transcript_7433/m.17961 type:complete len:259 (-) Transcript_7433:602-1378(-)
MLTGSLAPADHDVTSCCFCVWARAGPDRVAGRRADTNSQACRRGRTEEIKPRGRKISRETIRFLCCTPAPRPHRFHRNVWFWHGDAGRWHQEHTCGAGTRRGAGERIVVGIESAAFRFRRRGTQIVPRVDRFCTRGGPRTGGPREIHVETVTAAPSQVFKAVHRTEPKGFISNGYVTVHRTRTGACVVVIVEEERRTRQRWAHAATRGHARKRRQNPETDGIRCIIGAAVLGLSPCGNARSASTCIRGSTSYPHVRSQ